MIQDKELLLKDLCARLPYGTLVYAQNADDWYDDEINTQVLSDAINEDYVIKPYIFPLSSMTEEQKKELYKLGWYVEGDKIYSTFRNYDEVNYKTHTDSLELVNWCYKNHIDINGLIEKGLALDATGLNIY